MNILQLIQQNRMAISNTLNQLTAKQANATQRLTLFNSLKDQLNELVTLEEDMIYPSMLKEHLDDMSALDACDELYMADNILKQLEKIPCDTEQWDAGLFVLKENIEDYFRKEESQLADYMPKNLA